MGAFEVAFRASRLDLEDEGVSGGDGLNLAVAWNWYLNRYLRFQTNFVRPDRDDVGDVHALLFRFHFRFRLPKAITSGMHFRQPVRSDD